MAKLAAMGRQGVYVVSRPLRYRNQTVRLPDGTEHTVLVGEEKGIDVRIALDVIRLAHRREYDVAVVLSQDQDLAEVAEEIRVIAREQDRWIKIARCTTPAWIGATTARVDAVVAVGIACPCVTGAGTGARRLAILGAEGTQRPGIAQARAWRGLDLDRNELTAGLDDGVHFLARRRPPVEASGMAAGARLSSAPLQRHSRTAHRSTCCRS